MSHWFYLWLMMAIWFDSLLIAGTARVFRLSWSNYLLAAIFTTATVYCALGVK